MYIKVSDYKQDKQANDELAFLGVSAWLFEQVQKKVAADKELQKKFELLKIQIEQFLNELKHSQAGHVLSFTDLVGIDGFDGTLHANKARGQFLRKLRDAFEDYLKIGASSPKLTQIKTSIAQTVSTIIQADADLAVMAAANAHRTIAVELDENGFVPALFVPAIGIQPHKMSEADVKKFLSNFNHPVRKGSELIVVAQAPIHVAVEQDRFKRELTTAVQHKFIGLNAPTKVTTIYEMYDGKDHYVSLRASTDKDGKTELALKDSMAQPATQDTATYESFRAAQAAIQEVKEFELLPSQPVFTGQQKDGISCSYRSLQEVVTYAASDDARYQDITKASTIGELQVAINKRLVTPEVASKLVWDEALQVVRRTDMTDEQLAKLAEYEEVHASVTSTKAAPAAAQVSSPVAESKEVILAPADAKELDTMVAESEKTVERARGNSIPPSEKKLSATEEQAYAALKNPQTLDETTLKQIRATLTSMHETMLVNACKFDAAVITASEIAYRASRQALESGLAESLQKQEVKDAKIAQILQNQFVSEFLQSRKASSLTPEEKAQRDKQEAEDLALARKLSGM